MCFEDLNVATGEKKKKSVCVRGEITCLFIEIKFGDSFQSQSQDTWGIHKQFQFQFSSFAHPLN